MDRGKQASHGIDNFVEEKGGAGTFAGCSQLAPTRNGPRNVAKNVAILSLKIEALLRVEPVATSVRLWTRR